MAGVFKNIFGGASPSPAPAKVDDDFADFGGAPDPSPVSIVAEPSAATATAQLGAQTTGAAPVPFTKWYRVWERTSPSDFKQEAMILPFILLIIIFHLWGTKKNRRKAKAWAQAHAPVLQNEFAAVGFGGVSSSELVSPDSILRENSPQEFASYATGRQNVAFLDLTLKLVKRYNPVIFLMDHILSIFFESWPAPVERVEAVAYAFDGKEKELVPVPAGDTGALKVQNSSYDPFIWAVVHKNTMRKLRQDRYDVSMTQTKDNAKLPSWVTVMSESAEVTDTLLTPELIKAIEQADDAFEYLIISDQPIEKPAKIEETVPRKRLQLSLRIPSSGYESTLPLFKLFVRLPDVLVASAHWRPEVLRKIRNAREEEIKKLRRADEEEKAEERKLAAEKLKKEERERLLRSMSAEEQRKFLEREKEKEQRRTMKRNTRKA
ncbi:hypothetical protein DTO166G4_9055 [Paecilomyces variotii]|nr:hypothetical protein DTO166G4_9055 [Paecilomyces variotii]KAJ9221975.1 hypothetical protein DTO169C6_5604 [Paecilomyces variotii]KAJ9237718.1 hypothetical protein DTO166G5_3482 [Paecilomyces variotii]KAJ9256757.1 hypothetical protein DTO207G8_2360 [Paecilomyces variotii]KAJ9261243.1 hypothetical protein DTO195F2_4269 [Paecilomyces variotii]